MMYVKIQIIEWQYLHFRINMRGAVVVLLISMLGLYSLANAGTDMRGPPQRPAVFTSPEQIRDYVKAIHDYFAIVGRSRYKIFSFSRHRAKKLNLPMLHNGIKMRTFPFPPYTPSVYGLNPIYT